MAIFPDKWRKFPIRSRAEWSQRAELKETEMKIYIFGILEVILFEVASPVMWCINSSFCRNKSEFSFCHLLPREGRPQAHITRSFLTVWGGMYSAPVHPSCLAAFWVKSPLGRISFPRWNDPDVGSLGLDDHSERYIFGSVLLIKITIAVPWATREQPSFHLAFHASGFSVGGQEKEEVPLSLHPTIW